MDVEERLGQMNNEIIVRLQEALRTQTISYADRARIDFTPYDELHQILRKNYPHVFATAKCTQIAEHSLVLLIESDEPKGLPIALMGHIDVVPVVEENWKYPPFGAEEHDGFIYARGALDMKGQVCAMFEAMETLLNQGMSFDRDVYLLIGHNEETGSQAPDSGARLCMEHLKSNGIKFDFVLDEGGAFADGRSMGIDSHIALIGIAEKGYMDIMLSVQQKGGHASMPPAQSALNQVCAAAVKLENDKFPASFTPASGAMFDALAEHMKQPLNFLFKHRTLFAPILLGQLIAKPMTAALVRTTCVMTQAQGSKAPNVLPQRATVTFNLRIAENESIDSTLMRIKSIVGSAISVEILAATEPTPASPIDNDAYKMIRDSILETFPIFKVVAPYPVVAATDSRVYQGMAQGVYRFVPFHSLIEDLGTIHADNERINIESYMLGIKFFETLLLKVRKSSQQG
jgi:carboxypeptidase PM20D1